jgi:hypothetical protein
VADLGCHSRVVPRHVFRGKRVPSQDQPFQVGDPPHFHWTLVISESVVARLVAGSSSVSFSAGKKVSRQARAMMRLAEAFIVTWAR